MWIVEGGELSGAAVQVDKTWTKRWKEPETVINCNDTKWSFKMSTVQSNEND